MNDRLSNSQEIRVKRIKGVENPWISIFHEEYEILWNMRVCAIIFKINVKKLSISINTTQW